jgi:dienelactone hydrolase
LNIPSNPKSVIMFAHGSDSSASSPRNKFVADTLNDNGFATLIVDLLTVQEQESDEKSQKIIGKYPGILLNKFNIHLLSERLKTITQWIVENENNDSLIEKLKGLPIGYFGASTGAAAVIETSSVVCNSYSEKIYAIISRGGRPDLADTDVLRSIKASTLFIIGEKDDKEIISVNKKAFKQLKNAKSKDFITIPKAGHLFDEDPDIMEKVAEISIGWFVKNLKI